jgi:hypothetical protein
VQRLRAVQGTGWMPSRQGQDQPRGLVLCLRAEAEGLSRICFASPHRLGAGSFFCRLTGAVTACYNRKVLMDRYGFWFTGFFSPALRASAKLVMP